MNIQLQIRTTQEVYNLNLRNRITNLVESFWVEKVGRHF